QISEEASDMKQPNSKEAAPSMDTAYPANFDAWRVWIGQSLSPVDDRACSAAAHAAVLTDRLGATDSADSVASAKTVMPLAATQRDGVASVDPAQPDGGLLALRQLLASGWRPN